MLRNTHKTIAVSNALDVLRYIDFCDFNPGLHNDSDISNLSFTEQIKLTWDRKLLIPAMENFFNRNRNFNIYTLTADSGFDYVPNYQYLFENHGILPVISLNPRSTKQAFGKPGINDNGIPTYPKNPSLPMKWDGSCKGKNCSFRNKFIYPKSKKLPGGKYVCSWEDKYTTSDFGRMFYTYSKDNYRTHTPIHRHTEQSNPIADFRHIIDQVISKLKLPIQLGNLCTKDRKSIKADLFMTGVAHLINVLIAYSMGALDKIRSIKSIVA